MIIKVCENCLPEVKEKYDISYMTSCSVSGICKNCGQHFHYSDKGLTYVQYSGVTDSSNSSANAYRAPSQTFSTSYKNIPRAARISSDN